MLLNQVKIGGITYAIEKVQNVDEDGNSGECNDMTAVIKILDGLREDVEGLTLLHEILHAINMNLSEQKVYFLSNALFGVFRDNPNLRDVFFGRQE